MKHVKNLNLQILFKNAANTLRLTYLRFWIINKNILKILMIFKILSCKVKSYYLILTCKFYFSQNWKIIDYFPKSYVQSGKLIMLQCSATTIFGLHLHSKCPLPFSVLSSYYTTWIHILGRIGNNFVYISKVKFVM